jgi:hypothetical protein
LKAPSLFGAFLFFMVVSVGFVGNKISLLSQYN